MLLPAPFLTHPRFQSIISTTKTWHRHLTVVDYFWILHFGTISGQTRLKINYFIRVPVNKCQLPVGWERGTSIRRNGSGVTTQKQKACAVSIFILPISFLFLFFFFCVCVMCVCVCVLGCFLLCFFFFTARCINLLRWSKTGYTLQFFTQFV